MKATVQPSQVKVEVRNGTTTQGLARKASDAMAAVGFSMAAPSNWTSTDVTQTQIYYDPKYDESVKTVQAALPGAKLVPAAGRGATMLVVVGTDYKSVTKPVITVKSSTATTASPSQDIKARTAADNPCT